MEQTKKLADSINSSGLQLFKYMGRMRFGTYSVSKPITMTVGCREFDLTNITEEDVQWLDENLEVAYYSKDNVKTIDTKVRNSKYTKSFNVNLNTDKLMDKMGMPNSYVKPYKLNLYKQGCFFSKHRDTDRTGLLGTLILILPTSHSGGELQFEGFNLDAYQKQQDKDAQNKLRFVFFDTGIEHSVSEVTEGNRITVLYNVFKDRASSKEEDPEISFTKTPNEWPLAALKYAHQFCTGKTNILFGKLKYHNDAFDMILADLRDKFDVADVAVDKNDYDTYPEIEDITEVYTIDIEIVQSGHADGFTDVIRETYEVEHILFPSQCELSFESVDCSVWPESLYIAGSEITFKVEYYSAYLINPKE